MFEPTLLQRIDQALLHLVALVEETSRHLARLQLDQETEDKTLQVHTRACALQRANLRDLTQLRKQLLAPPASAPILGANLQAPTPAPQSPRPDSLLTPSPSSRLPIADSRLPSVNPQPPTPAPRLPTADYLLPTPDSRLPVSGALLKSAPNVAKLNHPVPAPRDLSPAPAGELMCGVSLCPPSRRKAG